MQDKTLNELVKDRQDLIKRIDKNEKGLNSRLELVNSKIIKRQKELMYQEGGIKMAEEKNPVVEKKKKVATFDKAEIEDAAKTVIASFNTKEYAFKVVLKAYSILRRDLKNA